MLRSAIPGPGPDTIRQGKMREGVDKMISRWSGRRRSDEGSTVTQRERERGLAKGEEEGRGFVQREEGDCWRRGGGSDGLEERGYWGKEDAKVEDDTVEWTSPGYLEKRQAITNPATSSSSSSSTSGNAPLFVGPSNSSSIPAQTQTSESSPSTSTLSNSNLPTNSVTSGTVTVPWLTSSSTNKPITNPGISTTSSRTRTVGVTSTATVSQYVPNQSGTASSGVGLINGTNGLLVGLSLNGDSVGEAVYAIPLVIGHNTKDPTLRRRDADGQKEPESETSLDKRNSASNYQSLMMQVDLGSSDMWVAASTCMTSVCVASKVNKFNAGNALDAGNSANLTYQSGYAAGEIYWDEVQLGVSIDQVVNAVNGTGNGGASGFGISAQAFVAATQVQNEDLSGGVFSGLIGLALPANSIISGIIPGTYGSSADGATFLDNLFASGASEPTARYFTLSLERSGDPRTISSFGVGSYNSAVCGVPCVPTYSSLVGSANGPLYWRVLLQGITITNYTNPTSQSSGWSHPVSSQVTFPSMSTNVLSTTVPVAVLDSGGSQILFANRGLLDTIYANWGVSMSSDGYYYIPCTTPMMISFQINSVTYPVHPLDMSDYYKGTTTCIGSMQYGSGLSAGDIILGSTFLKNVYSVFTYPSANASSSSWNPQVGFVSLTNASASAQEFYNVRSLQEPIPSATSAGSPTASASLQAAAAAGNHAVSVGGIVAGTIVGLAALTAGLFCAWYFWLRRKYGEKGGVPAEGFYTDDKSSQGTRDRQSKKSMIMQRQKSMIDGYSDFETLDSWPRSESKTDMGYDSPDEMHVVEELGMGEVGNGIVGGNGNGNGSIGTPESDRHRRRPSNWDSSYPPVGWTNNASSGGSKGSRAKSPSPSTGRTTLVNVNSGIGSGSGSSKNDSPVVGLGGGASQDTPSSPLRGIPEGLISPTRQPLIWNNSHRHEREISGPISPRREATAGGSYFEMQQMDYAKELARHVREDSSGSSSWIPMASPKSR